MDIKENLANNLIRYRKAMSLTQVELAEKLNYSDKAVSKWERGESFPDLYVLKQIADFYGVTIDVLISEPKELVKSKQKKATGTKRAIIALCSVGLVWLVAMCCFAFMNILFPANNSSWHSWLSFIYALPVTAIVLLVLTSVWKKKNISVTVLLPVMVPFMVA
jgi:transcriptional regulator with XRE-family HTH domain